MWVCTDGHTYERSAIEYYLQTNNISPMTREIIEDKKLVINLALKNSINDFVKYYSTIGGIDISNYLEMNNSFNEREIQRVSSQDRERERERERELSRLREIMRNGSSSGYNGLQAMSGY